MFDPILHTDMHCRIALDLDSDTNSHKEREAFFSEECVRGIVRQDW